MDLRFLADLNCLQAADGCHMEDQTSNQMD